MAKSTVTKKIRPKRPVGKVLQSVSQVLKITHIEQEESIWQWGQASWPVMPQEFAIGVWNVWKGSGGANFLAEYKKLSESCQLLLIQEALLTLKGLEYFATKGFCALHGATYRRKDGARDGVMTVSRADLCAPSERILCLRPEPLLKTTKATLVTYYKIDQQDLPLCVVNTHATLLRRPKTAVKELEQVIDRVASHRGPMVFAGDFNTFFRTYTAEVDRALASIGLTRVNINEDPRRRGAALDQIYVRGIEVIDVVVDTGYHHSDHFPIVAKLKISA